MAKTIKVRAKSKGGVTTVKCLITHPMEPGNRKDQRSEKMVEPHFIQEVTIEINGKAVLSGMLSGGISKNPYLSCKAKGNPGDTVRIAWVDNKGNKDEIETKVK